MSVLTIEFQGQPIQLKIGLDAALSLVAPLLGLAEEIETVAGIAAHVTTVAGVETEIGTVAGIAANVTSVATIAANVTAVAGIAANVTTVAGISANVTAVAGIAANVTTVAGIAAAVSALSAIDDDVSAVSGIAANVTTVAGMETDISALLAVQAAVLAVAAIDTEIAAVAGIAANVTVVAAIDSEVAAVSAIAGNVTSVATIAANVTTVAGIAANVTTVAGIAADVTAVAAIAADVALAADNIDAIQAAPTIAAALEAIAAGGNIFVTNADMVAAAPFDAGAFALVLVDEDNGNHAGIYEEQTGTMVLVLDLSEGVPPSWGDIGGTLADQSDLQTALNAKAPLASPAFTGAPTAPTPSAADNSAKLATTAYVDSAVGGVIAAADAMVFKGVIDCSANPNYPAADRGWTYRVSVAGKIGGGSGPNVEAGDMLLCLTDGTASGNHATVGANWEIVQANLDGAVIGPASSVDNRVALFNGTTGKVIKDGGVLLAALATLVGAETFTNKRINPRVVPAGGTSGSQAANADTTDQFELLGLTGSTTVAAPTGTPVDGQKLLIHIEDNGTGRGLTWNSIFLPVGATLPSTTVANKEIYVGCIYRASTAKWNVVAVSQEA